MEEAEGAEEDGPVLFPVGLVQSQVHNNASQKNLTEHFPGVTKHRRSTYFSSTSMFNSHSSQRKTSDRG